MSPRKKTAASIFALVAGALTDTQGHAQSTDPDAAPSPEEVIVSAQRRTERFQDVPISASVVSGTSLERANIQNLQDLSNHMPNVRIAQAPAGDQLMVRGVGSGLNLGFEQSVATFVDGIYRGRSRTSRVSLFDIERVEVLKGPQTTFFGNNAIAGALNITTRKPSATFQANASALYGSDNQYDIEIGAGGPLTDTLRARAAVRLSGMDGYISNAGPGGDGPHQRDVLGRMSFDWTPASAFEMNGRLDHGRLRDSAAFNIEMLNCPADPAYGAPRGPCARSLARGGGVVDDKLDARTYESPNYFNYDYTEGMLNSTVALENNELIFLTGYFHHSYDYLVDNVPGVGASAIGTGTGLPIFTREDYRQFSQEIRFQSTGHHRVDYMAGAYGSRGTLDMGVDLGYYFAPFGAFGPGLNPASLVAVQTGNHQTDESLSFFGSATVNLSTFLRVNAGLRYSVVDKHAERSAAIGTAGPTPGPGNFVPTSLNTQLAFSSVLGAPLAGYPITARTDRELMPSLSLQYDLVTDVMTYASFTHGFKAGGFGVILSRDTFRPETVDAYEVGVKGSLLNRKFSFNFALYYDDYNNLQEAINTVNGNRVITAVANAARSVSKGVELGASLRATPWLTLSTDLAYLSAKYTAYRNGTCTVLQNLQPLCVQDLSGKDRSFSPKYSGNAALTFSLPVAEQGALRLTMEPSVYFSSSYYELSTADSLAVQASYAKLDTRIGLGSDDGTWEIAVIGKNLTDSMTAGFRNGLPGSPGSVFALADRPRSIAVQFTLHH